MSKSEVKVTLVQGEIFNVTIGRAAYGVRAWGGEGVHCADLLEDTGVELLEWWSSPAAATPTMYLGLRIWRREDQTN
jgi:hypothetical protein